MSALQTAGITFAISVLSYVLLSPAAEPARAQQAVSSMSLYNYPRTDLGGLVTAEIALPEDDCRTMCSDRSGCAGFDYSKINGMCRLYGIVSSARSNQSSAAGTRALLSGYPPPANPPVVEQTVAPSAPPLAPRQTCIVDASSTGTPLNLRDQPLGQILGTLADGVWVEIQERRLSHGRSWVRVSGPGNGWVAEDYLRCTGG